MPQSSLRVVGFDIGGTKCAVSCFQSGQLSEAVRVPTGEFAATFARLTAAASALFDAGPAVIGVACGGPLDAASGTILAPSNLPPSWHGAPICRLLGDRFGVRAHLMNDANAGALAEWMFGAGAGCRHMVFLTAGTGLGAGLILNGQLYEGGTGDAGEIGHVRLRADGPVGYGKAGSAEGFCSGGGIARLAEARWAQAGGSPPLSWLSPDGHVTLQQIAEAARAGDESARIVLREAGGYMGEMLSMLIDLFNPERIVLGGFYPRCRDLLDESIRDVLAREALPIPRDACQIVPAKLGEMIGNFGAVAAALHGERRRMD